GWTGFNRAMYYREIIARFGHYNGLYWNIAEEYNENYNSSQARGFAQMIGDLDAYDHPITVHNEGSLSNWNSFVGDRRFGLTSFQKNDTPHNAAAAEWFQKVENSGWTIPISFDETGALGTGARDLAREIVWSVYTGGANFEMLTQPLSNFTDFGRHFEDMTRARGVVESLPFPQMRPSNSLLTGGKGYVFAQAGEAYLVYLPDGGNINLNLSASSNGYSAQWFNPRDGSTRTIGSVAGGGVRSFSAPDGSDWALVLRRSGAGSNVAPTVSPQAAETPVDTPRDLTLAYTDPDGPGPYTFTIDQPPAHGTLSGTGAGRRYTPAAGYTGPDGFRWQVNDGKANSEVVTFSLSVKAPGANVPPVAPDRSVSTARDSTIYIQLVQIDPDGPGPSSITIVQQPAHGTLTGTDNDRFYTPNPGFVGADSFTWQVNDGLVDSNVARVSIQVTATDSGDCQGQPAGAMPCIIEQNGVVAVEAEHYTAQSGYSELTISDASGGKAMQVGDSGHLDFEVSFVQAGRWYFWIRSQAHDHEMNGLLLEVDGIRQVAPADHPQAGFGDIYLRKGTTWFWRPEWKGGPDETHVGPVTIDLASAGTHTISIVKRGSEEPWLDKIVLTRDSAIPDGMGPGETTGSPSPNTPNTPPTVNTGPNQAVTLPAAAALRGTVSDDGLPRPPSQVATSWSEVSGEGTVIFGDSSAVDTTASFSRSGTYLLRLTANDGELSRSDDLTVTVSPAPKTPAPGDGLVVSDLAVSSGKAYEVVNAGLKSGARVYIDRSFTFTSVPGSLQDALYIQTANDDKKATQQNFLSFSVNQDVTVYVAYDSRASGLPGWLSGWTDVGQILDSTDVALDLYSRDFAAGPITLGGNLASGAAGASSSYTVVIIGHGTAGGGPAGEETPDDGPVGQENPSGGALAVAGLSALSNQAYRVGEGLSGGDLVYIDRDYTYTNVPAEIDSALYVITANEDKTRSEPSFLTFSVNQDVTVYVAYDSRAGALPGWLRAWTDAGQTLDNTDVALDLYSKDFVAGPVTLGGNLASGAEGAASNYTLVIVGNGTSTGGPAEDGTPDGGPVVISGLSVSSNKVYQVGQDLSLGDRVYIDRDYTYSNVPAVIDGAVYVSTANDDKAQSGASILTFSVDREVTVYVAYDSRATSLPAWLAGWSNTGSSLNNTDTLLKLYARDFAAGPIALGGNLAAGAAGALSNYSVVIVSR
ncbi:MAG TPA: Ig-like domain-containing protein, partial [Dehalococcoidia bacterium]|nr:Ig-like domain-containing protein [Dehalococcoidia bacterium]